MVGSTAVSEPPVTVVDMLERTRLMQPSVDQRSLHITDRGYEFMLRDIHVQMWFFMLEYIKTVNELPDFHKEDILQFLFQLSYCETNGFYAIQDLTKTQQMLLNDFMDFGLLIRTSNNSKRFYTTSLAVNLIFAGATGQQKKATRQALTLTHSFESVRAVSSNPQFLCVPTKYNDYIIRTD
jgi:transcription initiation factor TFIIH subunit 4